ncbi:MAG: TraB/GumN family protein [Burkholderiales bacterium]|nr:MAG: TraB/GumN family protein [Burkholderiales bacterium]
MAPCAPRRALLRGALLAAAATAGCAYRSLPGFEYAPPAFELARPEAPGRIVLLATVHAGLARFYPLPEPLERAFGEATRLIVEIDTDGRRAEIRAAATARALLPEGATLANVLRPETLRALRRALHQQPWTLGELQRLQPWALALLLPDPDDLHFGADPRDGVELHLIRRARARALPIVEMETAEAQVAAFAGGSLAEQDAALALRLAHRDAQSGTYVRIVDAWRRGDLAELAALKDFAYPPEGPLAALRTRLFADRDAAMAEVLDRALDEPGRAMALVGALHLAGPDALQHALVRRGVGVRRLAAT